jgi:hypothetical protein
MRLEDGRLIESDALQELQQDFQREGSVRLDQIQYKTSLALHPNPSVALHDQLFGRLNRAILIRLIVA